MTLSTMLSVAAAETEPVTTEQGETVTYYFLAPDSYCNTENGAANSDVGYYYWQPSEVAPWPGAKATPAPEVGYNVFKITTPNNDETGTIIFNAFVDAGTPADPELAAVAHQTVNIDVEEDNYDGMIYVLCNDEEHQTVSEFSGTVTTSGDWFSINPDDDNYYKNSDNYKTYNFAEEPVETPDATYYFLAPDAYCNTEKGASNSDVGYYYWQPSEVAPWPGAKATPAPEVGYNVFKITVPNNEETGTIIFNAFVDAGNPADPALAAVAHQTVNINVEEDNYDGMIYVLANDEEHQTVSDFSGAVTTSGDWFSINPDDDNYYMNSDNYKTYDFNQKPEPPVDETEYKKDKVDYITVDFLIGGVDKVAAVNGKVTYDSSVLTLVDADNIKSAIKNESGAFNVNTKEAGTIIIGAYFDPAKGESAFAGDKVALCTFKFKAEKDFKINDLNVKTEITYLLQVDGDNTTVLVDKTTGRQGKYTDSKITVEALTEPPVGEARMMGDVDNDKDITSADALSVLRYSVGLEKYDDTLLTIANVNKDTSVDSLDSLLILRKSVGLNDADASFETITVG